MAKNAKAQKYTKTELFKGVSLESVEYLLEECVEKEVEKGEIIISPERKNKYLYVILRGQLIVYLDCLDSPPLVILKRGSCTGEMSIINKEDPSAYVVAHRKSCLLLIEQKTVWALINTSHAIAKNLLYILSGRIREDNTRLIKSLKTQSELEQFAMVDALTGLYNRRWLNETLPRSIKRSDRENSSLSLIMIDLDHFKQFNDNYGHLIGDEVLRVLAAQLRRVTRPEDMIARFGGEEFIILLPNTNQKDAIRIAKRIHKAVTSHTVELSNGPKNITISIGISSTSKGKMTAEQLLETSDQAMYRAKNNGRNRIEIYFSEKIKK